MKITKRNGIRVDLDKSKIISAITRANEAIDKKNRITEDDIVSIANKIEDKVKGKRKLTVENVQEMIEFELMEIKAFEIAKAYIEYSYLHKMKRDRYEDFMEVIDDKLRAKHVQNQNANVDEKSFGGRIGEASSYMNRKFALEYVMSEKARTNHLNNEIYTHDLDHYIVGDHNCLSVPMDKLLAEGFNTRQTDVRPAQSVSTAFQLVAVIFQLQSLQQFGGVSATHLDWTMAPYVRKSFAKHYKDGLIFIDEKNENEIDHEILNMLKNSKEYSIDDEEYKKYSKKAYNYAMKMTERETKQAVEGLYHNLNY